MKEGHKVLLGVGIAVAVLVALVLLYFAYKRVYGQRSVQKTQRNPSSRSGGVQKTQQRYKLPDQQLDRIVRSIIGEPLRKLGRQLNPEQVARLRRKVLQMSERSGQLTLTQADMKQLITIIGAPNYGDRYNYRYYH